MNSHSTVRAVQQRPGLPYKPALGLGSVATYVLDESIFREGAPAEYLYEVVSGAVRACKLFFDGRRHVTEYYVPGDLFGFDHQDRMWSVSAEAASKQTTIVIRRERRHFEAEAAANLSLSCWLNEFSMRRLTRARGHILLLGRLDAMERIAAFLLELNDRSPPDQNGNEAKELSLPMSRVDIADYLCITRETLSRGLQTLVRSGTVELRCHGCVKIVDIAALRGVHEHFTARANGSSENERQQVARGAHHAE